MKKKVMIIIGSIFIIAILIFAYWGYKVLAIDATKKQSFNKFALSWMKLDYSSMYNQLSNDYKKSTTENEFINNMKKIYGDNGIEATNIKITPQFPAKLIADKDGNLRIPFTMIMDTIAGKVSIKNEAVFINENASNKKSWKVIWSKKMIFPQMEPGDKVYASYIFAKRGQIEDRNNLPLAVNGTGTSKRVYPLNEAAAQLVGYVKNINQDELKKLKNQGYTRYDSIGETGIEKIYEKQLKGKNGAVIYIKDSMGTKKATIAEKKVQDGKDIKLTVDSNIQNALYNQLKGDSGTAVAVNPKTGEILAMVSTPSFNPNLFALAKGIPSNKWNEIINNPLKPLNARFTDTYAPGSTFKVITAAIGIKSGKLLPQTAVKITGLNWQLNRSWGSYFITRVDNILEPENLEKAFVYSDNIYFAQTALKITKSTFIDGTKQFGIGEEIPFEYPLRESQISKDGSIKNDIQLADSGYGQGEVSINPVQLSMIYGSLVNGGSILKPHLLYGANLSDVWKENVIPEDARSEILNDLIQVIEDPHGTGHGASIPGISLAGKTGTAEIKRSQTDKSGTENGWFVCVNTDNPKLLVTMMIENVKNRDGSAYVTPKVASVMRQFAK